MDACPSSTRSGCKCPLHAEGLLAYARDPIAFEAFLAQIRTTEVGTLRIVQLPSDSPQQACTGKLTCECPACSEERLKLVKAGSRDKRQPWMA